jgi:hypothetical protein
MRQLPTGLLVADASDVVADRRLLEISDTPVLFTGVQLFETPAIIDQRRRMQVIRPWSAQNVLYCHGYSTASKWTLKSGFPLVKVLAAAAEQGIAIDALFVCNPGRHRLRGNYTYVFGNARGSVRLRRGPLIEITLRPAEDGHIRFKRRNASTDIGLVMMGDEEMIFYVDT